MTEVPSGHQPEPANKLQNTNELTANHELSAGSNINPLKLAFGGLTKKLDSFRLRASLAFTDARLDTIEDIPFNTPENPRNDPTKPAWKQGEEREPSKLSQGQQRKLRIAGITQHNQRNMAGSVYFTWEEDKDGRIKVTWGQRTGDAYRIPPQIAAAAKIQERERNERIYMGLEQRTYDKKGKEIIPPTIADEFRDALEEVHKSGAFLKRLGKDMLFNPVRIDARLTRSANRIKYSQLESQLGQNIVLGRPPASKKEALDTQQKLHAKRQETVEALSQRHGEDIPEREPADIRKIFPEISVTERHNTPEKQEAATRRLEAVLLAAARLERAQKPQKEAAAEKVESNESPYLGRGLATKMNSIWAQQLMSYGRRDDIQVFEILAEDILGQDPSTLDIQQQQEVKDFIRWHDEHIIELQRAGRTSGGENGNTERLPEMSFMTESSRVKLPDEAGKARIQELTTTCEDTLLRSYENTFGPLPRDIQWGIRVGAAKLARKQYLHQTAATAFHKLASNADKEFKYKPAQLEADQRRLKELLEAAEVGAAQGSPNVTQQTRTQRAAARRTGRTS